MPWLCSVIRLCLTSYCLQANDEVVLSPDGSETVSDSNPPKVYHTLKPLKVTDFQTPKVATPLPSQPSQSSQSSCSSRQTSPLPFEVQKQKRPAPERINPPCDTFAKKNKSTNKKFEDLLMQGFGSLNSLVERSAQPVPVVAAQSSANAKFAEYLVTELDEIPKEHQAAIRKELILCLNEAKEKRNIP